MARPAAQTKRIGTDILLRRRGRHFAPDAFRPDRNADLLRFYASLYATANFAQTRKSRRATTS
ncbi:hypothetical protein [Lysobacter sp. yr284]|uniref:hypothetical protein n=1 Tax=Lysobacter sp. yr284 TaxID=1761791 RepID=UPI0011135477|nr:hypothetical protein [Lysobacter sp. yr284]